jgi:hypothetical protein
MSRIALVELDDHVVPRAAALQPPELRTIDAIHLARSSLGEDLGAICDYDSRLADAAASAGVEVAGSQLFERLIRSRSWPIASAIPLVEPRLLA